MPRNVPPTPSHAASITVNKCLRIVGALAFCCLLLAPTACRSAGRSLPTTSPPIGTIPVSTEAPARSTSGPESSVEEVDRAASGIPTLAADLPASGPLLPASSPDTDSSFAVAYVDAEGLWLFEEGVAEARQIAAGDGLRNPLLDPARRWIAWQKVDPARSDEVTFWELWVAPWEAELGDARQVLTPADLAQWQEPGGPAWPRWIDALTWIPGESTLVFTTYGATGGMPMPARDLWSLELPGTAPELLIEAGQVGHFKFAPDGRAIAVVSPGRWGPSPEPASLKVYERSREEIAHLLDFPHYVTNSEFAAFADPIWVDRGEALLMTLSPPDLATRGPKEPDVFLRVGLDGSLAKLGEAGYGSVSMQADRGSRVGSMTYRASWSARIEQLAVVEGVVAPDVQAQTYPGGLPIPTRDRQLLLAAADGTGAEVYDRMLELEFMGWSSEGGQFLYGDRQKLFVGERGVEPSVVFEATSEGERFSEAMWAGPGQVLVERRGMSVPPLLELRGLDGQLSRTLAQGIGIDYDVLP